VKAQRVEFAIEAARSYKDGNPFSVIIIITTSFSLFGEEKDEYCFSLKLL
jgi:hypothetical protein